MNKFGDRIPLCLTAFVTLNELESQLSHWTYIVCSIPVHQNHHNIAWHFSFQQFIELNIHCGVCVITNTHRTITPSYDISKRFPLRISTTNPLELKGNIRISLKIVMHHILLTFTLCYYDHIQTNRYMLWKQ